MEDRIADKYGQSRRRVTPKPRRTRLADVAREADVSTATVSRALRGASGVRPELRERILAIANRMKYERDPVGLSLRSGKTHLIGVWVESVGNNGSARLVSALTDTLHPHGYAILVSEYSNDRDEDASRIRSLAQRRPDYMVVLHPRRIDEFEELVAQGHQIILISAVEPEAWDGALISVDSSPSRRELARHLVELGHRRGLVLLPVRRIGRPGWDVLRTAAEQEGLPLEVEIAAFAGNAAAPGLTAEEVADLVRAPDGPTFLQVNEALAPILLEGLKNAGLRVPDDVSVMTTGTPLWANIYDPPLNATDIDYYLCGVLAAEVILDLESGKPAQRRVVSGTYTRRQSVGPARKTLSARP